MSIERVAQTERLELGHSTLERAGHNGHAPRSRRGEHGLTNPPRREPQQHDREERRGQRAKPGTRSTGDRFAGPPAAGCTTPDRERACVEQAHQQTGPFEGAQTRKRDHTTDGDPSIDKRPQALEARGRSLVLGAHSPQRLFEVGRALQHGFVRWEALLEGAPLVDPAQPLHQDLFGRQERALGAVVCHLLGREVEAPRRRQEELEDHVIREAIEQRFELGGRDIPTLPRDDSRRTRRAHRLLADRATPLRGHETAQDQRVDQLAAGRIHLALGPRNRAAIEEHPQRTTTAPDRKDPTATLLANELEDGRDTELAQIPVERDLHYRLRNRRTLWSTSPA